MPTPETTATATLWEICRPTDDTVGSRTMTRLIARINPTLAKDAPAHALSEAMDNFRAVTAKIDTGTDVILITAIIDVRGLTPAAIGPAGLQRCEEIASAARAALSALRHGAGPG